MPPRRDVCVPRRRHRRADHRDRRGTRRPPGQIPEIRDYRFGPDLGINEGNHQYAVVADFDSVDDYLVYRDHPAHLTVIAEAIRPILAARAAVQFAI